MRPAAVKSGAIAAAAAMLALAVTAPAFAQWYLPGGNWMAGEEPGSYYEDVHDERGNFVDSNWIYPVHDDNGNFLEWEWFLPVHDENWERYEWISLVPAFDHNWDFLDYDLYVYDLDLNLVEHVEGFSPDGAAPIGFADDIPADYGGTGPSGRELELRGLYDQDEIYWYAAWLEANGGPVDLARTTIHNSTVYWAFTDSKGNLYEWDMPIVTYENQVKDSEALSTYNSESHTLRLSSGDTVTVPAFEGFVVGSFDQVIDDVYENAHDNYDFVHEVWHIVSQMTVYDEDVDPSSEGRFALETFTRGGGDCEDLAILVADMLRSSSHTKSWEIQLVYMDSDHPRAPQDPNHVVVSVDYGDSPIIVEATGEPDMYGDSFHYPDGIRGWFYDV